MQCNVEPVEEGAKYHVSYNIDSLIICCLTATCSFPSLTNSKIFFQPFVISCPYGSKIIILILSMLSVSPLLANFTAKTGG